MHQKKRAGGATEDANSPISPSYACLDCNSCFGAPRGRVFGASMCMQRRCVFTVHTAGPRKPFLRVFQSALPSAPLGFSRQFSFLLGTDTYQDLRKGKWRKSEELMKMVSFVIVDSESVRPASARASTTATR